MRMRALLGALFVCAIPLLSPAPAGAAFGLSDIAVSFTDADGSQVRQAGSHPFAMTIGFRVNTRESPTKGVPVVDGALRDLDVVLPAGFVGDPSAVPRCRTIDFLTRGNVGPDCSDATALGMLTVEAGGGTGVGGKETVAVFNLQPSPGVTAKLGFWVVEMPVIVEVTPAQVHPYNVVGRLRNTSQIAEVLSSSMTLWGNPGDPRHDPDRGDCAHRFFDGRSCAANIPERPFITLPRSCDGPLKTIFRARSWWSGDPVHPGPPEGFEAVAEEPGATGCSALSFAPDLETRPTTERADSASGLEVDLDVDDEGLLDPLGVANSDVLDAVLALPAGVTANPSLAEGLATCAADDLARETLESEPGEGCPQASKIGTVAATTPVLEGAVLRGALFIAPPEDPATETPENPFGSLLALHMVIKDPTLGVLIKQPGLIEPDPRTGQLVTTFADLPPYPLKEVRIRLREGGRSPLITPPACGLYSSQATLTPSGNPSGPLIVPSSFRIERGVDGAPCPAAGSPPFEPGFGAGTLNNDAASFSPFHMRLTRRDGDQDLTRFDATLPRGVLAKLAGVERCPDAAIAAARGRAGRAELAQPLCPRSSRIGGVWGGAGVGSQLTYVPGSLYLAGPVGGAPLSVVAIVPAVAGPFDVGTVVVRQALQLHPRTAEVSVDGSVSNPIPHILAGIPLRVRDIRVDVDRPTFTLNPTNCDPFATVAQIWGGGADPFGVADDSPVPRSARFQAASCAQLRFKPRLSLRLRGGTGRGAHPAFTAVYRPRSGDANVESISTRLPRSAFLDQAHIRTICTRVQFAAGTCPAGAVYGHVTAITPLLEEPLKGPVYLRSSNNELPDLVLDLHGLVDVEAAARIDSVNGGIRVVFPTAPDAPLTKVVLRMQGGKKGLIQNSADLCAATSRARVVLGAQNGKRRKLRPAVRPIGCHRPGRQRAS